MAAISPLGAARALTVPVVDLGARWMFLPETMNPAKEAGYPNGFVFYFAGRGGVLGDVDADVVSAAFGYFEPALVRRMWEAGVAVEGARAAARRFGVACAAYGSAHLDGVSGIGRLTELAEQVVDAGDVVGLPLFAGWRAESRPPELGGRAIFLLHLLRELRGSLHIVATTSQGLSALESILAAPLGGGTERATQFGWREPFPDPAGFADRRRAAEDLTDQLMARRFEVLSAAERTELVELVTAVRAALDG